MKINLTGQQVENLLQIGRKTCIENVTWEDLEWVRKATCSTHLEIEGVLIKSKIIQQIEEALSGRR